MSVQLDDISIKIAGKKLTDDELGQLVNFKVSFSNGTAAMAKINLIDDNFTIQEKDTFSIGKEIDITISKDNKDTIIFKGEVARVDYIFEASESDSIQIICYDGLYKVAREYHSRAFLESKISAVASTMAGESGLSVKVDATTTKHEHIYQNNQSNLEFLTIYAKRLGYEINVFEGKLHFTKAGYQSKVSSSIELEWGVNLTQFDAKIDVSDVLVEVTVNSWDTTKKVNVESVVAAGKETKIGAVKTLGTSLAKSSLKNSAKVYKLDIPDLDSTQAKAIATAQLTSASLNFLVASGMCEGNEKFKIGQFLDIKGVGKKISGDYYITSYEHVFNSKGFKTYFEVKANGIFT